MFSALVPVVAVPARNEADRLPHLLGSLNDQQAWASRGEPLSVVVVLNNTTDGSASILHSLKPALPNVDLHIIQTNFASEIAHVGSARRLAMETAAGLVGSNGILLTTDADAVPAPDWVLQNLLAIGNGVDLVGGRIIGDPNEEAMLGNGFQRRAALYAQYAILCDELSSLIDPVPYDPWPRHQDHTGGSLAVRADVYRQVGGMPALPFREDIGFVANVLRAGCRLVHPMSVSVTVSARTEGRAPGGMAYCVKAWVEDERIGKPILVEAPELVEERFKLRQVIRSNTEAGSLEIARRLQEQAEADLDVVGTVLVNQAIDQLMARLSLLRSIANAA